MEWQRKYTKPAKFDNIKPKIFYEAETEQGFFVLLQQNSRNRRGQSLKAKVWELYVNGRQVPGSRRYRLTDAKNFALGHLEKLGNNSKKFSVVLGEGGKL